MSISLLANVQETVNAIDQGLRPVVDDGRGDIYVLNTSRKQFGNLVFTQFDRNTLFPIASFTVRYGTQHVINEVLFGAFSSRRQLEEIIDMEIPGQVREEFDPRIIPGCTPTFPTEVSDTQGTPKFIQGT
jgi:hypothetical protein